MCRGEALAWTWGGLSWGAPVSFRAFELVYEPTRPHPRLIMHIIPSSTPPTPPHCQSEIMCALLCACLRASLGRTSTCRRPRAS
eukprot:204104-Prymnesium_polylepis.1